MTTENEREQSPFGGGGSGRGRTIRIASLVMIPLLAIVVVWFATWGTPRERTAPAHAHGAVAAGGDSAQRISLSPGETRRIGVTYAAATLGQLGKDVRTVGQVTFDETKVTVISPKVDGWVEVLHVNYTGQPVRAGEPLLAVYSPMLVTAQEELLLAARLQSGMAEAGADARANAAELLASARRRLAYWDIPESDIERIERSGKVQRTLTLRASASGVVIEKNVSEGQRIMAGDVLYRIADLRTVWVEGEVFEQDLPAVRPGLGVTASFEALPGEQFHGKISYVYPTLDPETRTAKVRVELPNPGLELKPGMYATLRLTGTSRPTVLSVPRSAVLSTGERNLVFVRRADGMRQPREVAVGIANDERIEILHGLGVGDTVVASGTFLVDAESNLGTVMGGMGDMPGMDMTAPATKGEKGERERAPAKIAPPPSGGAHDTSPAASNQGHQGHEG
jgi:Cu(I)/Ag(I) efflux system membrane fusion protein